MSSSDSDEESSSGGSSGDYPPAGGMPNEECFDKRIDKCKKKKKKRKKKVYDTKACKISDPNDPALEEARAKREERKAEEEERKQKVDCQICEAREKQLKKLRRKLGKLAADDEKPNIDWKKEPAIEIKETKASCSRKSKPFKSCGVPEGEEKKVAAYTMNPGNRIEARERKESPESSAAKKNSSQLKRYMLRKPVHNHENILRKIEGKTHYGHYKLNWKKDPKYNVKKNKSYETRLFYGADICNDRGKCGQEKSKKKEEEDPCADEETAEAAAAAQ